MRKILSVVLSFGLLFQQSGLLYAAGEINLANYLSQAKSAIVQPDVFQPERLRYISYDIANNDFKILLDKGNNVNQKTEKPKNEKTVESLNSPTPKLLNSKTPELNESTRELFNYFLTGLALPNDTFWVNLRPDAPENIIDPILEKTDIGKIFLEADLQLKKDTASLTSPQNPEGKLYWDKLYKKAGELFGTENITIPTITRPWIVPNEVIVRETEDSAYIYKATLKVMLESDYLIGRGGSRTAPTPDQYIFSDPRLKELNEYSSQIIRETIIPKLTKEINSSKRYAKLRQVYYSLVLSRWFKQKYGLGSRVSGPQSAGQDKSYVKFIDSRDLTNFASQEPCDKQTYFQSYQKSFKDGEYNLKETVATPFGQSIRSYISGGIVASPIIIGGIDTKENPPAVTDTLIGQPTAATASPLTAEQVKLINNIMGLLKTSGVNFDKYKITSLVFGEISDEVRSIIAEIKVKSIIAKMMNKKAEDINMDMSVNELLLNDSLSELEFISFLEESFGVDIVVESREDIFKMSKKSVNKIIEDLRGEVGVGDLYDIFMSDKGSKKIFSVMKKIVSADTKKYSSNKILIDLLKQICRVGIEDLLNKAPKGVPLGGITKSIAKDKIGDAAPKLGQVFLTKGDYKNADACNLIRNAWQSVTSGSPLEILTEKFKAKGFSYGSLNAYVKLKEYLKELNVGQPIELDGIVYDNESIEIINTIDNANNRYAQISVFSADKSVPYHRIIIRGYQKSGSVFTYLDVGQDYERQDNEEKLPKDKEDLKERLDGAAFNDYDNFADVIMTAINKAVSKPTRKASRTLPAKGASSSLVSGKAIPIVPKRGGIDLTDRMLKIKLERVGSFASSALVLPEINNVEALDLDKDYGQIQAMVNSGIRPSDTRILEFAAACYYKGEFDQRLAQVSSCIKAAHLADEISGRDSSEALRLATMLPDALYGG